MRHIKDLLNNKVVKNSKKHQNEHLELMFEFLNHINPDRIKKGLPPLSVPRLGHSLRYAGIPNGQIYAFLKECEKAKNFTAFFWWSLKDRKLKKKLSTPVQLHKS